MFIAYMNMLFIESISFYWAFDRNTQIMFVSNNIHSVKFIYTKYMYLAHQQNSIYSQSCM
jgi:hypothetical protein